MANSEDTLPLSPSVSPLGTSEAEHEAFRCGLLELVADKITPELGAVPAFGPLGAVVRETPVFLHSLPALKALSTHALTDGRIIFVASETLHQKEGPLEMDIVSMGLMMRSVLQAAAIKAHLFLKSQGRIAGPCYAFPHAVQVTPQQVREALEKDAPELVGVLPIAELDAQEEQALLKAFLHPYPQQPAQAPGQVWKQVSDELLAAPSMEALSRRIALPPGTKRQTKARLQAR